MRAWRLPIIVVLLACIAGAVAYEQRSGVDEVTTAPSDLARLMPVVPGPGASRSTWFCAGGSATGQDDGVAEQTVTVLNAGDAASSVVLTAMMILSRFVALTLSRAEPPRSFARGCRSAL